MTQDASPQLLFGVDLGGTKIEAAALDANGRILGRRRTPTPTGDYRQILDAIVALVRELEVEVGRCAAIGVGTPGATSPSSGVLRNSNTQALNGQPLERDLAAALGRPCRIANDANCFALSEATDGAGAGATCVFGVILGTGVGGGVVVDGRVLAGANRIAGEWGHNPLPWPEPDELPGRDCYCGRRGCIETWLSGPALGRDHLRRTGDDLNPAAVVSAAADGDREARASYERYCQRLARALAQVVNLLDPDVIVLGGGLSKVATLYEDVASRWHEWVFSDVVLTRLVPPRHGDSSGVRGAAWLWR